MEHDARLSFRGSCPLDHPYRHPDSLPSPFPQYIGHSSCRDVLFLQPVGPLELADFRPSSESGQVVRRASFPCRGNAASHRTTRSCDTPSVLFRGCPVMPEEHRKGTMKIPRPLGTTVMLASSSTSQPEMIGARRNERTDARLVRFVEAVNRFFLQE